MRNQILSLFNGGKLQDLLDILKKDNFNPEETDVDVLWAVAEAYAKTKQTQDAHSDPTKSIIDDEIRESDVRLATIQKAMAALRMSGCRAFSIAMGRVNRMGADLMKHHAHAHQRLSA